MPQWKRVWKRGEIKHFGQIIKNPVLQINLRQPARGIAYVFLPQSGIKCYACKVFPYQDLKSTATIFT